MHRTKPISVLVYNELFPNPGPNDPPSFSAHLSKNLVGEVRIETATFYGSLDTIEARYPGLNYAYGPHRKRLGRFPHHKRLFAAFDNLGLTDHEIQGFCRWEGTLWARERYERDEGVQVRDTTGSEIGPWLDTRRTTLHHNTSSTNRSSINVKTDISVAIEEVPHSHSQQPDVSMTEEDEEEEEDDEEMSDDEAEESVGYELNQRLIQAAAMRDQGVSVPMDPLWEQYLKEAQERGELGIPGTRLPHALNQLVGAAAAATTTATAQTQTQTGIPYGQAFGPSAASA